MEDHMIVVVKVQVPLLEGHYTLTHVFHVHVRTWPVRTVVVKVICLEVDEIDDTIIMILATLIEVLLFQINLD